MIRDYNRVTAVFDSPSEASSAISALRTLGVAESHLSVIGQDGDHGLIPEEGALDDGDNPAQERIGKGALAGAGAGTLFGLAALAIPGVGPFITAGWFASTLGATGGALAAGAIVGGASGALAGAFTKAGYDEHEAHYYGSALESGDIIIAVDTGGGSVSRAAIISVMAEQGGRSAAGLAAANP